MTGAAHHKTKEDKAFKRKQVFHLWDVNGIDFSGVNIRARVKGICQKTVAKFKREYKKERGLK
jgi:hypothetical protein